MPENNSLDRIDNASLFRNLRIQAIQRAVSGSQNRQQRIATIEALALCVATVAASLDGPREPDMDSIQIRAAKVLELLEVPDE